MAQAHSYELLLPDALTQDPDAWESVLQSLSNALRVPHIRLFSYVNNVEPLAFEAVCRARMALQQSELGRRHLEQEARTIYSRLRQSPAWSMRHYLVTWGLPLQAALPGWLVETAPPEPFGGIDYDETLRHLLPLERGGNYLKIIATYAFEQGQPWEWQYPWAELIARAHGPMIVCLDAVRISDDKIRAVREGLQSLQQANARHSDAAHMAKQATHALYSGEESYEMRLVIMLSDPSPERLEVRAQRLRQAYSATLAFSLMEGKQGAAVEFFTAKKKPVLGVGSSLSAHSFVLGSALPVSFGGVAGVVNRIEPKGVYIGFRKGFHGQDLGPSYFQLWPEGGDNRANHVGICGAIGGGKTTMQAAILGRYRLTENIPIVWIEPMGHSAKLARLLEKDPGLHFYRPSWDDLHLNTLDWSSETLDVERGMPEQFNHVKANVEVMLKSELDDIEDGFLGKSLRLVYAGFTPAMLDDAAQSPRLQLLCDALRSFSHDRYGEVADRLAERIAGKYVDGSYGRIFNAATNLPLSFDGAHLFDVSAVAGKKNRDFQTILYYTLLTWFMRSAYRDKRAGKVVRRIFAIDEYFVLSQNPFLRSQLDVMVRTLRNLYTSVWISEQTLSTFVNAQEKSLYGNIPFWFLFKQELKEARLAVEAWGQRCPEAYAELIPTFPDKGPRYCVALLDQTMLLRMDLLGQEAEVLAGSNNGHAI